MPLDDTLSVSDTGHVEAHEALHDRYNNSVEILSGDASSRPAATAVDAGTIYIATDTAEMSRSDGATWTTISSASGSVTGGDAHDHSGGDGAQIDHGGLAGNSDDDHTQYSKADGTRAFTGTVAGVDPTDDTHLATRKIADTGFITFAKSGELAVTTDTGAHTFPLPYDATIIEVEATVGEAPTGADALIDVHVDGTTIFTTQSNRVTIADAGTSDSSTTIEDDDHDDGQLVTVNIDQIGSTTPGSNLTVVIRFRRR